MPGIVGLITRRPRAVAEAELSRMTAAICHESFYNAGTWVDEPSGVYAGWAARKGSFADGMPLQNEDGSLVLLFGGEEFPDPEMVQRLRREHRLTEQRSAYLVHVAESDPKFPASLNGRFHGLLIDKSHSSAMLFNDRYGMRRIYYYEAPDGFYFAAEAKAILAVRPELRSLDARGLGEFISFGCVIENRTLFDKLKLLPGGSAWTFRNGGLERKSEYFSRQEWETQSLLEPEEYSRELRGVFSRNLPRYFNTDERVAISLTGGLDTRMIMAWHKAPEGALPCYTFGGARRECRDVIVGREIARACRQPYQVIETGSDFLSRFSHYAERSVYLTEGCIDMSHSPDLYLNEIARKLGTVRVTGLLGGEITRRVRMFKPVEPLPGLFPADVLKSIRTAEATYAGLVGHHALSFAAFEQAPWHHYGNLSLEETQLSVHTPFLDNDFVRTVYRAPASLAVGSDACWRLIAEGDAAMRRIPTDRGLGSTGLWSAIRRSYLEFTFKAEYAYDYGMPQWLARIDHLFSAMHFERLFLGRHKLYHFRLWYRDVVGGYLRDILLDSRSLSRPYVERKKLEALVNGHLKGDQNYTLEIHKLLTVELLHRHFLDSDRTLEAAVERR